MALIVAEVAHYLHFRREGALAVFPSRATRIGWLGGGAEKAESVKKYAPKMKAAGFLVVIISTHGGCGNPDLICLDFMALIRFLESKGVTLGIPLKTRLQGLADIYSRREYFMNIKQLVRRQKGGNGEGVKRAVETYRDQVAALLEAEAKGGIEYPQLDTSYLISGEGAPSSETEVSMFSAGTKPFINEEMYLIDPEDGEVTEAMASADCSTSPSGGPSPEIGKDAENKQYENRTVLNDPKPEPTEPNVIRMPRDSCMIRTMQHSSDGSAAFAVACANEPVAKSVAPQAFEDPMPDAEWRAYLSAVQGIEIVQEEIRRWITDETDPIELWA